MNVAIFYADNSNSEFRREADRLGKFYNVNPIPINCSEQNDKKSRRDEIFFAFNRLVELEFVCFICHGWKQGIQLGFSLDNQEKLADALQASGKGPCVALYCCSTGSGGPEGDGGFADRLRDLTGFQVDAHDGAGHCTRRPYVRRFAAGGPSAGGDWIISPQSNNWAKWYSALKGDTDLRFRYPMMKREEIIQYLASL